MTTPLRDILFPKVGPRPWKEIQEEHRLRNIPKSCQVCRFGARAQRMGLGSYVDVLECRRRSPEAAGWPRVEEADLCGQFVDGRP